MIRDVRAKTRKLAINDPLGRFAPASFEIAVVPEETAEVSVDLVALPSAKSTAGTAKEATFWGGLGLAAIGRPAYITLGRAADLGSNRGVEAMRTRALALLDAANAAGVRYVDAAR